MSILPTSVIVGAKTRSVKGMHACGPPLSVNSFFGGGVGLGVGEGSGVGDGLGLGDGVGVGVGSGDGDGSGDGEGDGFGLGVGEGSGHFPSFHPPPSLYFQYFKLLSQ